MNTRSRDGYTVGKALHLSAHNSFNPTYVSVCRVRDTNTETRICHAVVRRSVIRSIMLILLAGRLQCGNASRSSQG